MKNLTTYRLDVLGGNKCAIFYMPRLAIFVSIYEQVNNTIQKVLRGNSNVLASRVRGIISIPFLWIKEGSVLRRSRTSTII